jgi:Lamin Tail Domain
MHSNHFILFLFIIFLSFKVDLSFAQITFTEVMNNPATNENHDEYVEIYNLTDAIVDLSGWIIGDSSSQDLLIPAGQGMQLNPNSYALILDGSYFGNSTTYDNVIPDSTLVIQVDGGTIASRLSNSVNRTLFLLNSVLDTMDQYTYIAGYQEGYSNEKIDLNGANDTSNWAQSLVEGGTPGKKNSVTPAQYDIGFDASSVSWKPTSNIISMNPLHIAIRIYNLGLQHFADNLALRIFIDSDNDSVFSGPDPLLYDEVTFIEVDSHQNVLFEIDQQFENGGIYNFVAELYDIADQNSLNNRIFFQIIVLDKSNTLHINEIKFLTNENEPEWLELYNSGQNPLLLKNWAIADERDTSFIDTFAYVGPGQYKVLASAPGIDSLYGIEDTLIIILDDLPSLNNNEDIVYLLDPLGGWQEQVPYNTDWLEGQEWHNPSLERINSQLDSRQARNWGPSTAAAGATPGQQNAVFSALDRDLKSNLSITPNPFSPDADGQDDYTLIQLGLPTSSARIKIEIYDILGRKIRTLTDNSFSGARSSFTWNGEDSLGRRVRMGIYIVYIQILNDRKGLLKELKGTVVVARKL